MIEALAATFTSFLFAILGLEVYRTWRLLKIDWSPILNRFDQIDKEHERIIRVVRDEILKNREGILSSVSEHREEVKQSLLNLEKKITHDLADFGDLHNRQFEAFSVQLNSLNGTKQDRLEGASRKEGKTWNTKKR